MVLLSLSLEGLASLILTVCLKTSFNTHAVQQYVVQEKKKLKEKKWKKEEEKTKIKHVVQIFQFDGDKDIYCLPVILAVWLKFNTDKYL